MKKSIVKSLGLATLALTIAANTETGYAQASGGNPEGATVITHVGVANPKTTSVLAVAAPQMNPSIKNGIAYTYANKPAQERKSQVDNTTEDTMYNHVTSDFLNVRAEPNADSPIKDTLVKDWTVEITERTEDGWGKLKDGGYINLKYTAQYATDYGKERLEKQSKTPKPSPKFDTPKEKHYVPVRNKNTNANINSSDEEMIVQTRRTNTNQTGVQVRDPKAQTQTTQKVSSGRYTFNSYELDLFARIVRAESGDEPYVGQVAVASVILNRLDSKQFPDTLEAVVYQRNQFSPVTDGSINKPATDSSRRAVQDAINGNGRLYNAIYFYAPKYVQSSFMESRPTITQIGGHIFKR